MNKDVTRRLACVLLASALSLPLGPAAHAVDLYARAIGDPYAYEPKPSAPPASDPASPGTPASAPDPARLPALGGDPPAAATAPASSGWSWRRVLIGVVVVGAMVALVSKDGGGSGVAVSTGSPSPNGGGDTGANDGGIGISPLPPLPPVGSGGDDDDDRGNRGKGRR